MNRQPRSHRSRRSSAAPLQNPLIRVLLAAQKVMNKQGAMKILNVNSDIMEVFEITGFSDILTIE